MNNRARRRGQIQLEFHFVLSPELEQTYRKLFQALFKKLVIERVALWELPGASLGLSGMSMFLAKPFGSGNTEHNALVLRVGPKAIIDEELRRYRHYIEPLTGFDRPQSRLHATVDGLSAIDYDYLHRTDTDEPLQPLRDFLWEKRDVRTASQAVTVLLLETLARGSRHHSRDHLDNAKTSQATSGRDPRHNRWYNDAHLFEQQRPLWFYNQILPPTLLLEVVTLDSAVEAASALVDVLAQADQPDGNALHSRMIALKTSTQYPRLRVVERKIEGGQARLRVHVFERSAVSSQDYEPLLPVAARVDLVGPPEVLSALPDKLDRVVVYGRVQETRYAHFHRLYQQQLSVLSHAFPDGRLRYASRLLANPVQRYHALLSQPRALHTSIIHGDMNLGNILFSQTGAGTAAQMRAWLIDFEKTGPGGHTVFDVVKLETEYKIHILPHLLHSVEEFILLEQILHQALIAPDEVAAVLAQHPDLRDPYHFIATLRRIMLCDLHPCIPPIEYYLGLLGYGLAALKYRNLYEYDPKLWLSKTPPVKPLAVAAYISASFAASAIMEIEGVVATEQSYPQIETTPPRTIELPETVGGRPVLAQARQRMRTMPPVVVLYGSPGSGRWALAQMLCAELEQARACIWPRVPTKGFTHDPEAVFNTLVVMLQEQGESTLSARLPETHTLSIGQFQAQWASACDQLAAALDRSEHPIVVLLHLEQASPQFRTFTILLAQAVRRTRLVIVADYPLDGLDASAQIAVPLLEPQDIEAYVQSKRLRLDAAGIEHLHQASHGLPGLLLRLVHEASQDSTRSFQAAVMQLRVSKHVDDFCDHVLERLPQLVARLVELAALVWEYSPAVLDQIESLFRSMAARLGWGEPQAIDEAVREYRQRVQQDEGLLPLLRPRALHKLRSRPDDLRRICGFIAQWLTEHSLADRYVVAQYWSLAQQWQAAAEALADVVSQPGLMFSSRCQQLYDLTLAVLEHEQSYAEESLFELAGNCAAYLGNYKAAARHYERVIAILPHGDPLYARLNVQRLHVLNAAGEDISGLRALLLRHVPPTNPLHALCLAYQVAPDDEAAAEQLETVIRLLEATRAQWGGDASFYEEQLVRLNETLAYVAFLSGNFDRALEILRDILVTAKHVLKNRALTARFDSVLGSVYMSRGQARDLDQARQLLVDALELRQELGDHVGQIYTAQNLAFLIQNLAHSAEQWDEAEKLYTQYEASAQQIDAAKAWMVAANHMELLIRRGAFERVHALFDRALSDHACDQDTLALLLLNRAKAALWERDAEQFQVYVARFQASTDNLEQRIEDRLEWLQLSLEAHLLLSSRLDPAIAVHVLEIQVSPIDQPVIAARWSLTRGLLALTEQQPVVAVAAFADSRALWSTVGFHYDIAIALLWEVYAQLQMQAYADAQAAIHQAKARLEPFGATPALRWLDDLTRQVETSS